MEEDDVVGELHQLFEQCSIEKWYSLIEEFTFRTVNIPLCNEEARAVLRFNRFKRGEIPTTPDEEIQNTVQDISGRLEKILQEQFKREDGTVKAFIKLTDRSPKDATNLEERIQRFYEERIKEESLNGIENKHLQSYIWAKGRALIVSSAQEGLDLLYHSERVASELEMKLELSYPPKEAGILIREWVDFDPAYEFRCFVSNNQLTGGSQMATMDIKLHYPQTIANISTITQKVLKFFNESIQTPLKAITSAGPSNKYVVDIYYDPKNDKCYVVELNPFQTSSSGHLYQYWGDDLEILEGRTKIPFEIRLFQSTTPDFVDELPQYWKSLITSSDLVFLKKEEKNESSEKGDLRSTINDDKSDVLFIVLGREYNLHKKVLCERSESLKQIIGDRDYVRIDDVPPLHFEELIKFIYSNYSSEWDTGDWNSLIISSMEMGFEDVTEKLVLWRELQTQGQKSGKHYGDTSNRVIVGWKKNSHNNNEDDISNCLSYSFEVEGNSLLILNYYRPEYISEEDWLTMSLHQRGNEIKGNWAKLKRSIPSKCPYWMNPNLTIEDSGFLWEVSYGGSSPGYCLDLDHLADEFHTVIGNFLSLGDREMDSGLQAHISFPFMEEADKNFRKEIFSLMVHLDDHLFLRDFSRAIIDDCNNLWSSQDVHNLIDQAAQGKEVFEEFVSKKGMPNPNVKHKHIGLRGIDTYKVPFRFGFEIRRGHSVDQLEEIMNFISNILKQIGYVPSDKILMRVKKRLYRGAYQEDKYSLKSVVDFIFSESRVAFTPDEHIDDKEGEEFHDKLTSLTLEWFQKMYDWEMHLINCKLVIWGNTPPPRAFDPEIANRCLFKLIQRMKFILYTDWEKFPAVNTTKEHLVSLKDEQAFILQQINGLLGAKRREEYSKDEQKSGLIATDTVRLIEIRCAIADFACRLSNLY